MSYHSKIFRKNDIRGLYEIDFDLEFVHLLAQAFLIYSREKTGTNQDLKIALGHDCRLSSPEIAQCMAEELAFQGAQICFLGMVPSPLCFFASHFFSDIEASIMVTASHNPARYNGFKFQLNKESISDQELLVIRDICASQAPVQESHEAQIEKKQKFTGKNLKKDSLIQYPVETAYRDLLKENFSSITAKQRIKKIAVDCGNGASGPLVRKVCESLNLPVCYLYDKPDGHFPNHHPDPSLEENLKDLKKTVVEQNCDFGAAFDGDGDRLVIVDKKGRTLHGDELMAIFVADMVEQSTLKKIVVDVKCADWFFEFLKKNNVKPILWKSGHALIRQKTLQGKAGFGGELSGHFFFPDDFFPIDDGLYTLLRLIKIITDSEKSLEALIPKINSIETYEIRIPIEDKDQAIAGSQRIREYYSNHTSAKCLFIDGIRVSLEKSWGLVRFSNTQSEMTLRFGGKTQSDLQDIQRTFYELLGIAQPKGTF